MKNRIVLEKSTNTHELETGSKPEYLKEHEDGQVDFITDDGIVVHGEHGTMKVDGKRSKVNQMEYNPVTQGLQKAFD